MKYRARTSFIGGLFFLAIGASPSFASSWSVTGILQNDTLNIRSLPSSKSDLLGEIPANGGDINVIRCIGVPKIEQLEATDAQTIKKALSKSWCLVRYKSTTGWVSANYLKLNEKPVATDREGLSTAPVWLAVFSNKDLVTATNKAISYQSNFPFVSVMASQSGFYAVVLGAGAPNVLEQQRRTLISKNSIPIDSYLTAGNSFLEVTWPKPPSIDEVKKFAGNLLATGTGIIVSKKGFIITNNHVIDKCGRLFVRRVGEPPHEVRLLSASSQDDMALLKADTVFDNQAFLRISPTPRLGENVIVFGFPLSSVLASSGNVTAGLLSASVGVNDDPRFYQISAPVQYGNSGGPLMDTSASVIGIVTLKMEGKLTDDKVIVDVPQNVNFALKSSTVYSFLTQNGVEVSLQERIENFDVPTVAEMATGFTVFVECYQ